MSMDEIYRCTKQAVDDETLVGDLEAALERWWACSSQDAADELEATRSALLDRLAQVKVLEAKLTVLRALL